MKFISKPTEEGVWEWVDKNGKRRKVLVYNVSKPFGKICLRVFWNGGYYNINDECIGTWEEKYNKAEWPDRWGEYVGPIGSVQDTDLYLNYEE